MGTLFLHGAHGFAGAVKSAGQVHANDAFPSGVRDVGECVDRAHAGVIDQHVHAAQAVHYLGDQGGHFGAVGDIDFARDTLAT